MLKIISEEKISRIDKEAISEIELITLAAQAQVKDDARAILDRTIKTEFPVDIAVKPYDYEISLSQREYQQLKELAK